MVSRKTKLYLGVDVGSISTKAVVIDEQNKIFAQSYIWTEGDPIGAVYNCIAKSGYNIFF